MAVPDLDFTDIINNSPEDNSSGYFKELMQSVNSYINEEFIQGRIVGTEYANVYLGAMQYAMQQAVGFAMQEHINNEQAGLIEQQKLNAQAEALNIPKQGSLLDAQAALTTNKNTTETKQQSVLDNQANLYDTQASAFKYRHNKDLAKVIADTWLVGKEGTVTGDYVQSPTDVEVAGEHLSTALSNAVWP